MRLPHRIFVAALLLGMAPAAWADHRTFSITFSSYPHSKHMDRVQALAHELEQAAAQVHADAEDEAHHLTARESWALARLHRLEDAAARFHEQVESYSRDPRHTGRDFRALVRSYNRAAEAMEDLHAYESVDAGFSRVEELLDELTGYYKSGNRAQERWSHDEQRRY